MGDSWRANHGRRTMPEKLQFAHSNSIGICSSKKLKLNKSELLLKVEGLT